MKKKFVSSIVFIMLVAGFQARAQEVAVDKGVLGVENENFTYVCKADDQNSAVVLKVKNIFEGGKVIGKIVVENGAALELDSSYAAELTEESSFLFYVTKYAFFDKNNNFGEFTVSEKKPGMTRGGSNAFCGRAGCDFPEPIFSSHSALLKIYEKEIPFTCQ